MTQETTGTTLLTRRRLLQSGAALAGVTAGSGALSGFPTIWAQNIKDVTINHAGPPVTAIPRIAEQASKDLGFTVHMQASENADLLNRFLSQSNAIDVADIDGARLRQKAIQKIHAFSRLHADRKAEILGRLLGDLWDRGNRRPGMMQRDVLDVLRPDRREAA